MRNLLLLLFVTACVGNKPAEAPIQPSQAELSSDISARSGFLLSQIKERDSQIAKLKAEKEAILEKARQDATTYQKALEDFRSTVLLANANEERHKRIAEQVSNQDSLRKQQIAGALERIAELSRDIAKVTEERNFCYVQQAEHLLPQKKTIAKKPPADVK